MAVAVDAADIKIITKYGKTGGIAGRLNTTSDTVNGREICKNNPTPGCDFSSDSGWSDNATPNDGSDDTYSGDLLVRTNDYFELIAAWSWNGEVGVEPDTITLTSTLPQGYVIDDLPGSCDTSLSKIEDNGRKITCVRKGFDKNRVGTVAEDLTFNIRVLGSNPNGATPGDISFTIQAENASPQSDNAGATLTVTAAPRWNLQKSRYWHRSGYEFNGQKGFLIYYKYYIEVDEVNGESDTAPGFLGVESMGNDATFTFSDDLSSVSPNAKLVECRADTWSNSNDPYPYYNSSYPNRSIATPKGIQTISCSQSSSTISVNLKHVDATLNHIPHYARNGTKLPVNRAIAAIGVIEVFVPIDDVKNGKDGVANTSDDGSLPTTNRLTSFDPTAPSGNSNFGNLTESEKDNSYSLTLYYAKGGFSKAYATKHGQWIYTEGGSSGWRAGDGLLSAGAEFATRLSYTNDGGINLTGGIICDVIDANRMTIEEIPSSEARYNGIGGFDIYLSNINKSDLEFEYASTYEDDSYLASNGGSLDSNHGADIARECKGENTIWYSSMSEAKQHGLKTITKVRIRVKDTSALKPGSSIYAWIKHKVRSKTLNGTPLQSGDELVNYGSIKDNEYFTSWYQPSYIPHSYPNPPELWNGDRVTFTGGKVRIQKSVNKNSFTTGDIATFTLKSSYTNDTGANEEANVTVVDMLPHGLHYKVGSVKNANEPTVGTCQDISELGVSCDSNNQILIWNLGKRVANAQIDEIIYEAEIESTAAVGVHTNYALIKSPIDGSIASQRESDININITIPSTINLTKSVLNNTPLEAGNGVIDYAIDARNGSSANVTELDIIDILPFNGDGDNGAIKFRDLNLKRDPASTFHGNRLFKSVELIAHPKSPSTCDLTPGIHYYYTNKDPKTINLSPKDTSNDLRGSTTWCEGDQNGPDANCGFSISDVTAVRATGPSMDKDAVCRMKLSMRVANNNPDDIYSNSSGASATGVTLPVLSNSASTVIVKSSLGDYIWFDTNANGIQDSDESGLNDINVTLYTSDGTKVATTKTSNDTDGKAGYYKFDNLHSGDYYIQIDLPVGYNISPKNRGDDENRDSDLNTNARIENIHLGLKSQDLSFDAGIYKPSSIGSTIWYDSNKNGIQDSGEDCKNLSFSVKLKDASGNILSTQQTQNCHYLFTNLLPGTYKVSFELPNGYEASLKDAGSSDSKDSDIDKSSLESDPIIITNGIDRLHIDFGFFTRTSIGDRVWLDKNANGIQDSDEVGIKDIEVELLKGDGSSTGLTTKTDTNGYYRFENLIQGEYRVKFTLPSGYFISPKDKGSDDNIDSDIDPQSITTQKITLPLGKEDMSLDMGLYQKASIGDRIWIDDNANGLQDSGEDCKGVDVEVTLIDSDNHEIKQTTSNCRYKFENLTPGSYKLRFKTPNGYKITKHITSDDTKNSDINLSGETKNYTLVSNQQLLTVDAGFLQDASIGDRVWLDENKNGIQDSGEVGIKDIEVELLNGDGTPTGLKSKTDASGNYKFTSLRPDSYQIRVVVPAGFAVTKKDQNSDNSKDSDIDLQSLISEVVTLHSGENYQDLDAGVYSTSSIGDRVWLDSNANGIQDSGEKGIADIEVELLREDGSSTNRVIKTDANGHYEFESVTPGKYKIKFHIPNGYSVSPKMSANDNTKDSDVDKTTSLSDLIEIGINQHNQTIDLGLYKKASIGNRIWIDENVNGIQDSGEDCKGVEVEVTLTDSNNHQQKQKTKNCNYKFENLTPGNYTISVALPNGYTPTLPNMGDDTTNSDIDLSAKSQDITLSSGEENLNVDIGILKDASLGDRVWLDRNQNGIQDANESGIEDVLVRLLNGDGSETNKSVRTDKNGNYAFIGIKPGNYRVKIDLLAGYKVTQQNSTSEDKDSDLNPNSLVSDSFLVKSGSNEPQIDIGLYTTNELGDKIWLDSNANGIQDANESGVANIKLLLLDEQNNIYATTRSDESGNYLFKSLSPGKYRVKIAELNGYELSPKDQGDDSKDSDIDPKTLSSKLITIGSNDKIHTLDIALYKGTSVGDTIWLDKNQNGIQDAKESCEGIEMKVLLLNKNKKQIASTMTKNCSYRFEGLKPATYRIKIELPNDVTVTSKNATSDDRDSDIDKSGLSDEFVLISGQNLLDIDAGFVKNGSLGDTIWLDENTNGIQDSGEKGLANIKILLLDKEGKVLKESRSNKDGHYSFNNLSPDNYTLKIELESGFVLSPQESISDESKDSDFDQKTLSTKVITLKSGENNQNIDAGVYALGKIGDRVWLDTDADGIQDKDEKGIANIKVTLLDQDRKVVKETNTDNKGLYNFIGLKPAKYKVKFNIPNGYRVTFKDRADDTKDSDIDIETNTTQTIALSSGQEDMSIDLGLIALKKITGKVISDINNDKRGELPLKNVDLNLTTCQGKFIATTKSDKKGEYAFNGLIPGCYIIHERDPKGYSSVTDIDGVNDNNITVTLATKDINGRDFIDEPLLNISGHVRADMDFDGDIEVTKSIDKVLPNVEISLYKGKKEIQKTLTNKDGFYKFSDITPGEYIVVEKDPQGFDSLRDVDGANDNNISITLSQKDIANRDFDDQKTIKVSGTIRVDIDGDKIVDEPLKDTKLLLCKTGVVCTPEISLDSTYTDENGTYSFDGLKPGDYQIVKVQKRGYEPLRDIDGGDNNVINLFLNGKEDVNNQDFEDLAVAPMFIKIHKTVSKHEVKIGGFVPYEIEVENINKSFNYAAVNIKDMIPTGFKYVKGSARILRSHKKSKLKAEGINTVIFGTFPLKAKEKVKISYLLKVGVSVAQGKHTNKAIALQNEEEVSNLSTASVEVVADPFIDNAIVIGKIFDDQNENGVQDKEEKGIPGVRLATVSGMLIESDAYGRYHIADVKSGGFGNRGKNIIIKVDPTTLPAGAKFTTENPRVYRITASGLNEINFGVKLPKPLQFETKRVIKKVVIKRENVKVNTRDKIGSIYFDSDQSCIRPNQVKSMQSIAQKIKEKGHGTIIIEANTDARAPMWYNKKLAYKRAQSVYRELKHYLGDELIDQAKVIYKSCNKEVKFDPKYDWWGKPNIPRTKKECTEFGFKKRDCQRVLKNKKGGAK